MKTIRKIFSILPFLLLAVSCTERISIDLDESFTRLVVDGAITTDTMSHKVVLSKTSSYFYNQPAQMVTGAQVTISDGSSIADLNEKSPGIYMTQSYVFGIPGHTYTLNIQLKDQIGGYSDFTASSTLNPVNELDSISLEFHPEYSKEGFWEVKCYVQDPLSTDFYRFLISRNQKLITDTLQEWFVTDDRFFNGNYTNGASIANLDQSEPDEILSEGDTVTAEVNSIGKEYASFIWDAQSELFGSNPLFSGPPANVKGNINNGAIGFFSAYSVTRAQVVTPAVKK
jgi:hypothetical protein